jgi:hypothetical protein
VFWARKQGLCSSPRPPWHSRIYHPSLLTLGSLSIANFYRVRLLRDIYIYKHTHIHTYTHYIYIYEPNFWLRTKGEGFCSILATCLSLLCVSHFVSHPVHFSSTFSVPIYSVDTLLLYRHPLLSFVMMDISLKILKYIFEHSFTFPLEMAFRIFSENSCDEILMFVFLLSS